MIGGSRWPGGVTTPSGSNWYPDRYFPPSRRRGEGGIKAQSQRGEFGKSWWAKRWIKRAGELQHRRRGWSRGRSYARQGQVLSIEVEKGRVTAKVQGSRPSRTTSRSQVKTLSEADWAKLLEAPGPARRCSRPSCWPARCRRTSSRSSRRSASRCSPSGWSDLHDPVLLPGLVEPLQAHRGGLLPAGRGVRPRPVPDLHPPRPEPRRPHEPAGTDRIAGRRRRRSDRDPSAPARAPERRDRDILGRSRRTARRSRRRGRNPARAVGAPRRLGGFPFWRGQSPFLDTLSAIYTEASPRGLDVFLGPAIGAVQSGAASDPEP